MSLSVTTPGRPASGAAGSYIQGSRDLRIDMLRGLCVVVMVIVHVLGASPLYLLTGGDRFFTGAPEGFVLIAGFTAGLVYSRISATEGLIAALTKALKRGFSLYLLAAGLTVLFAPLSEYFQLAWATGLDLSRSLKFVLAVLTLHQSYTFINIMTLFTLLFLALPLALLLIAQGRGRIVLLASWLLWLAYQVYPDVAFLPWPIVAGHPFDFSSWQVLFFTPLVLGYHRERLPRLNPLTLGRLHLLTGLGFAALIVVFVVLQLPAARLPAPLSGLRAAWPQLQGWAIDHLFTKADVGAGRIVATANVFGFLAISLTRWWRPISRTTGWLILPFGQHALYAWTVHVLFVLVLGLIIKAIGLGEDNTWLNLAMQSTGVAVVWFVTRRQLLAVRPQNRHYWHAAPAALALLALLFLQHPFFDTPHAPAHPPASIDAGAIGAQD